MGSLDPEVLKLAAWVRSEVKKWVWGNIDISHNMEGACAIASHALWKVLKKRDYRPRLLCVSDPDTFGAHCWVELDGWVIDITATQFGGPAVACFLIGDEPAWGREVYRNGLLHIGHKAVLFTKDWGPQSPHLYKEELKGLLRHLSPNKV